MKTINLKRVFILLVTVSLFVLPSLNAPAQSIPIPLGDPSPGYNDPRSPELVPISAIYVESFSCILVNFKYDIGEVDYELVNLTTNGTAYGTIDSDSGSQIIIMSGDVGYYSIIFTLSSGTQYYGEFEITQ